MENNKPKGVWILGWLIIISGTLFLISDIFGSYFFKIAIFLKMISSYLAIVPTEIPWTIIRYSNYLILFIWTWVIIVFICGIGILKLKHIARISFIVLSILRTISFVTCFFISKFKLFEPWEYLPVLGIPFLYIVFFTRSKVKEQFKQP